MTLLPTCFYSSTYWCERNRVGLNLLGEPERNFPHWAMVCCAVVFLSSTILVLSDFRKCLSTFYVVCVLSTQTISRQSLWKASWGDLVKDVASSPNDSYSALMLCTKAIPSTIHFYGVEMWSMSIHMFGESWKDLERKSPPFWHPQYAMTRTIVSLSLLCSIIVVLFGYNHGKIHLVLSARGMPWAMMFKQTQATSDALFNWPGVDGGGWLS